MYNAVYSLTDIRKTEINTVKSSFIWDFKNQTTVLFPVLSIQRTLKSVVITYGRTFFHSMIQILIYTASKLTLGSGKYYNLT